MQTIAQSLCCVHYLQLAENSNLNQVHPICMCSVVGYCKHLAPSITSKFNTLVFIPCIVNDLQILIVLTNAQFFYYFFTSN